MGATPGNRSKMRVYNHKKRQVRAAFLTVLWLTLFGSNAQVRAQDAAANDSQSDDEEVFSLDGFADGSNASAGDGEVEPDFWKSLQTNLRLNFDAVSRVGTSRRRGKPFALNAVGLDIHKVVSSEDNDIGTLLLQPYLVRRDNALMVPTHVEDDDDWEFEFHQFWFNLTGWGKGRTNIRFGHMLMP